MKLPFLCLCILLLFISCDSTSVPDENNTRITTIKPETGSVYSYNYSFLETDSTFSDTLQIIETGILELVVTETENVPDGPDATFKMETRFRDGDNFSEVWFLQNEEALLEVAHRNAGFIPAVQIDDFSFQKPLHMEILPSILNSRERVQPVQSTAGKLNNADEELENGITVRSDPRIVLRLPLEEGLNWTAFESPFLQTRSVQEIIPLSESTSGKTTAVVNTETDGFDLAEWTDIIDETGLLSRVLKFSAVRTNETGNPGEPVFIMESFELIEIEGN